MTSPNDRPRTPKEDWILERRGRSIGDLRKQEALFALSNGSLGVRACLSELPRGNMRGVYLGGVFDRGASPTPDMVNLPCFLGLDVACEGERFGIDDGEVLDHVRTLDMKRGLLRRDSRLRAPSGRVLRWRSTRLLSIADPFLLAEEHVFTPENFRGSLSLTHHLDADTRTIDTWKDLPVDHYDVRELAEAEDRALCALLRLHDSRRPVCSATALDVQGGTHEETRIQGRRAHSRWSVEVREGEDLVVARFSTARSFLQNPDPASLRAETLAALGGNKADGFAVAREAHVAVMAERWEDADIEIAGDPELQRRIRFNLWALIQAGPRHDGRVGIGARGLTGEEYRGHVFWDTDLFMTPHYIFADPAAARQMLMYRVHTLDGARRFSAANYTRGARFSVQTADTGDDAGPTYDVDSPWAPARVGRLGEPFRGRLRVPWLTREEIQVNGCIAYAVWMYARATGDRAFLRAGGLELIVEIARYFASRMEWVPEHDRYELLRVTGADEMHIHADNNAYTNYLAWQAIEWARELYRDVEREDPAAVRALDEKIGLSAEELAEWADRQATFYLPGPNGEGLIPEQDGWFDLKPFKKVIRDPGESMAVMRTTRVQPNACGGEVALNHIDAAMDWQIVKQCDLVNLFWMIPDRFDRETMLRNYLHYEDGTIHMSSLSPNTSSLVAARLGLDDTGAYRNLFASASVDLEDYQFNAEWGRHMAAIGGAWLALIFGFGGLCLDSRMDLDLRPRLHPGWTRLRYRFHWQGRRIEVTVERDALSLRLLEGQPVELRAWGRPVALTDVLTVEIPPRDARGN